MADHILMDKRTSTGASGATDLSTDMSAARRRSGWLAREQEILSMDFSSLTTDALHKLYNELCSNYCKENAARTRPTRLKIAERLCSQGVAFDDVDVFTATWNVGNAQPNPEELKLIIPCEYRLYDLVCVGLQECDYDLTVDMHARAIEHHKRRQRERKEDALIYEKRSGWHDAPTSKTSNLSKMIQESDSESESSEEGTSERGKKKGKKKDRISFGRYVRNTAFSAEKRAKRAITSRAGAHFAALISDHLGDDYFMVRECELMQMRLFVFSRVDHRQRISHVEYASQATGIGGVIGNKGGLAVSLRYQDMRLCFVSCHLAAHRKRVKERNHDCAEILRMVQRKLATHSAGYLSDWDAVFFMGDMNYRLGGEGISSAMSESNLGDVSFRDTELDESVSGSASASRSDRSFSKLPLKADHTVIEREEVMKLIESGSWEELIGMDQLRREQNANTVLMGFAEAKIYPFKPTFKVAREKGNTYNDLRLPAYCDRILWHTTPSQVDDSYRVEQKELFSPTDVSTSDHKPVCSRFLIRLRQPKKALLRLARAKLLGFYVPVLSESRKRGMQICISRLQAKDLDPMDIGGKADPYIVAYSTELFSSNDKACKPRVGACRTRVCFGKLTCKWDDILLIRCPPSLSTPEDLQGKHLSLALWDFDTLSRDDDMGEVVICLDDAVKAYIQARAILSDRFEHPGQDAVVAKQEGAVHEPINRMLSRPDLFETKLADGSTSDLGSRQFAFEYPVVRNGHAAGSLSGVVTLFRPSEKLRIRQLKSGGWAWKCTAYLEQNRPI